MNSGIFGKASRLAHLIARAGARRVLSLLKPAEQRADPIDLLLSEPAVVDTPHGKIRFLNHSGAGYWRSRAIMTKEPGSLEWIDSMVPGSVFWDIGANIGVLTLYAAMRGDLKVWAFEPAAVNYYNLVANCELNGLERRVRCLRLGFSDTSGIMDLHVSQLMSARSFTFKESKKLDPKRESFPSIQAVQVCTIDEFIARYGAPCPNYIKIDVPGLTQEIFAGATQRSQIRRLDRFTLRRESTRVAGASPSSCPPGFQIDAPRHDVRREAPKPSRLCPRYFRHQ